MNYDTMPAGPDLDRLVAEKVMGWKPHPEWPTNWFIDEVGRTHAVHPDDATRPFRPSTNIAHAWKVVERMAPQLRIQPNGHTPYYAIVRSDGGYVAGYWTDIPFQTSAAPTAPLAICRAALMAQEREGAGE